MIQCLNYRANQQNDVEVFDYSQKMSTMKTMKAKLQLQK